MIRFQNHQYWGHPKMSEHSKSTWFTHEILDENNQTTNQVKWTCPISSTRCTKKVAVWGILTIFQNYADTSHTVWLNDDPVNYM